MTELVEFDDNGSPLFGSWSLPDESDCPMVILLTGDGPNGSKGATWQNFVPRLNERGIGTFLFDFSGLGHSPGTYANLTLTQGCSNFRAAMAFVQETGSHAKDRIGLIGSSYGGNVALLEAAAHPAVKAIGLKSPSSFLPEGYELQYGPELMKEWGEAGYSEEVGLRYDAVLDSLRHNTFAAAEQINAATRIVHGTSDSAVPIRHSRDLIRIMKNASILEIQGADHWYSEGNEWETMATDLVDFVANTL
jgi:uncharacterized protein